MIEMVKPDMPNVEEREIGDAEIECAAIACKLRCPLIDSSCVHYNCMWWRYHYDDNGIAIYDCLVPVIAARLSGVEKILEGIEKRVGD